MNHDPLDSLSQLETELWQAADNLRANSGLASSEYCMPVLGVIFLRHAANRFEAATRQIQEDQAAGRMPRRAAIKADYPRRRALMLPEKARYDYLLALPKDTDLGKALVEAMNAIEAEFPPLQENLPKDYTRFGRDVLEHLLRVFNSEALRTAGGDVFGRIYEYFLMKFAMQGAQDNGEFFTPPSLVQIIVNVIEPDHGTILDPACGSGGMFVQSSHFIERHGQDTARRVTFYGQEKTLTTIPLARMNLAVHGLQGDIKNANTYYEDAHTLAGKCDFVMANPPFNVDEVDAERVKDDKRLPFGLPGVNKNKKVSNGNYLWISHFYSYLNERGRAGFVMSSQASSAGHGEKDVRRKIVETGAVDVMISIRSNFFYTRTVPCELWFFDRGKPAGRRDQVLMLDARNIYRKVSRKINDFSREQLANLSAIVWLYRGQAADRIALFQVEISLAPGLSSSGSIVVQEGQRAWPRNRQSLSVGTSQPRNSRRAIDANPSLRGMLLGYVAEFHLCKMWFQGRRNVSHFIKYDDHDRKKKGDLVVTYKRRPFKIECKSLQTNSIRRLENSCIGKAQCDASDRRTVTFADGSTLETTCLLAGEFDILAVNLFAFENKWRFVFAKNTDLPRTKFKRYTEEQRAQLLASLVPVSWPPQSPFREEPFSLMDEEIRISSASKSFPSGS